jgi:uncharacterized membrane protein YccC
VKSNRPNILSRLIAFTIGAILGACISLLLTWEAFGRENWDVVIFAAAFFAIVFGSLSALLAPERTEKVILFVIRFLNP